MDYTDKDYYKILGVDENVDDATLKKTYFKLSKENHPDLHQGDKEKEEKFKEISEAYEILSNKEKRAEYDEMRKYGNDPFHGMGGFGAFSSMFGGGRQHRSGPIPEDGLPIKAAITISFIESVYGCTKKFKVNILNSCSHCNGTGSKSGKETKCPVCHGSGMVTSRRGAMIMSSTCPNCHGSGFVAANDCPHCSNGFTTESKQFSVDIPAGVFSGQGTIVSHDGGNAGKHGGRRGPVIVFFNVIDSNVFVRESELDISIDQTIPLTTAILGGEVEVPTPYGPAKVKIPAGSKTGSRLRLSGKGFHISGREGNLYINLIVSNPSKLTKEQEELFDKFKKSLKNDNFPEVIKQETLNNKTNQEVFQVKNKK